MSESMTHKGMIEVLRVTAEDLGHRGRNTLLEWSIRNIEAVLAALKAEPPCACEGATPLAEVDTRASRYYDAGNKQLWQVEAYATWEAADMRKERPVRVLVFALPAEEEKV